MTRNLRPRFWQTVPLAQMTPDEWEALCDGCGKCCLNKLEDEETSEVAYTCIGCRLLDGESGRCKSYANRLELVPECIVMTPKTIADIAYWLPKTCAYKRLHRGQGLPDWHPLLTGDPESVHRAGVSVRGRVLAETDIPEDDWEDYIIEEVT